MSHEQWGHDRNDAGVCVVCFAERWMWCDGIAHQQALQRARAERNGWQEIATKLLEVAIGPANYDGPPPVELIGAAAKELRPNVELFWNTVMEKYQQMQLLTGQEGGYQRLLVSHHFRYNTGGATGRGSQWTLRFRLPDDTMLVVDAEETNRQRVSAAPADAPRVQECRCGGRSGLVLPAGHDVTAGCPVHGGR